MSEYWVAHKKYFCKYCNIYIADDAPSKRQHETGLRHKGNVERFVRGLYKAGEKRKQDLEEEKREMARVEKAAQAAYAQDVGAGLVKPGSSSAVAGPSSAAAPKVAATLKPSNPFANYSTAESLGYTDPDEARRKAEEERRKKEGVAGEWEVVDVAGPPAEEHEQGEDIKPETGSARAGEKRPAEQLPDEDDTRGWKLRRKTVSVGLGELYDPGAIPIKLKTKTEESQDDTETQVGRVGLGSSSTVGLGGLPPLGGSEKPSWSARGWSKPGASSHNDISPNFVVEDGVAVDGSTAVNDVKAEKSSPPEDSEPPNSPDNFAISDVKVENGQTPVKAEPLEADVPPPSSSSGSLFKKRKVPVAGGSRGGRRF
ncbi:hypothetical protein C8Q79DRAFT_927021 [Trametes meyenii]|nr:hypothetical protein C8Q79DRAFT_927021 [Trametes meyenii]